MRRLGSGSATGIALSFGEINSMTDVSDEGSSGARERLRNLGYDIGEASTDDDDLDPGTRTAVALFQRNAQLPLDGTLDATTSAKLTKLHGA